VGKIKVKAFFVGYLPMPASLRNFYRLIVFVMILIAAAVALWISSAQQGAGNGTWNAFELTTLEGTLKLEPYPVLYVSQPKPMSVLLVQLGKLSADALAADFNNKRVAVTGFPIQRGDWFMLEIADKTAFNLVDGDSGQVPEMTQSFGKVSLRGEIVDSKCFLGVMKPGAGKVHRNCAALCLKGGIPPVLIVKSLEEDYRGYLLTMADGSSAATALATLAAVPVEISGELEERNGLLYLRLQDQLPRQLSNSELAEFGSTLMVAAVEQYSQCAH
jgi:hypothetical protein